MAEKYWWQKDEEKDSDSNSSTNAGNSSEQSYWWNNGSVQSTIANNITSRVNTWLKNHNNYVSNYENRNKYRKYNYDDPYVKDSASWLETVSKQKSAFDAEADSILAYVDQYKGYLDDEWVKTIQSTLTSARGQQAAILDNSSKDNEWWSNFKDESEYHTAVRYDGYNKKYNGQKYNDLQTALGVLDDGEEKDWLTSYASYVDYDEKSKFDLTAGQNEIKLLEAQLSELNLDRAMSDPAVASKNDYYGFHYEPKFDPAERDKKIEELENILSEKRRYFDEAKYIQDLSVWNSVTGNADFDQKNKYVSNVQYERFGKPYFTDDTYAYVNNPTVADKRPLGGGDQTARALIEREDSIYKADTPGRNRDSSYERDALEQISAEEVAIYNYYYATEGKEKAKEYLDFLVDTFKQRKDAKTVENAAKFATEHPFLSSAMSVSTSLGSGAEYIGDVIEYAGDTVMGKDAKLDRNENALVTNAVRGAVAEKVDWEIGNWDAFDFVYNTTMSGIDSAASLGFGGMAAPVLGLSAAAQATNDAMNRGMSDGQAFWNGIFAGTFECLFERLSIGQFKKLQEIAPNSIKDIIKNLGKSMLVNASEETLTEIANIGYDTLVNGEFANYTMEELENGAWKEALAQVIEAGASGMLMGLGMGGAGNVMGYYNGAKAMYGESTDALIQEGLESDPNSRSYKLAQKYQQKTAGENGKELSGVQIRKLVKANEAQFKVENFNEVLSQAKDRLNELGQTENVDEIANLVAKRVSGQKMTRDEKSTLAKSQYGSKVAKEITDSAKENEITYKSLTDRVGEESHYGVSKSGQTEIRATDAEVDGESIKIKEVSKIENGQLYVKLEDGREVYAGDIDFANDRESVLYSAIADMENITPAAATALAKNIDLASDQSVSEYVNGIDEAYTYGYQGYSVEDMKVGDYAVHLSNEQMMSAYKLGQSARSISNEAHDAPKVQMRTAMQAAISKKQATQQLKTQFASDDVEVYFEDGANVVKFDEHSHQYDEKRMAGVNAAKFLSKMGIGSKYYFYESYENSDGVRVYKDSHGNEVKAPNGIFKASDGSIHIDINAGNNGEGTTLFTMGHELTHFVKANSAKQFQGLADLVKEAYDKTDMTLHERVVAKQNQLSAIRGEHVTYDEAFEEVVADAMSTMFTDGNIYEKLAQLKTKDKGLFNTIKRFFDKMIAKFKEIYASLTPDQKDAQDIRELKDMFDRIQDAFAKALVEASENFQASETVLAQAGISVDANTDAGSIYSVRDVLSEADRNKVAKALAERFDVTVQEAKEWLKAETSLASLILNPKYSMYLDYEGDPNEVAIKQNSDYPQGTVDFSNICKKRREFTQVMNRILRNFPNHVFAATDLAKIRTIMGEEGMTLPCGICYVEDRRQLDTIVAQDFINGLKLYREGSKTRPDGKPFNANQLKGLQLTDGDTYVPTIYELVSLEGRNSLKAKNPNMEAAWVRYNNARGMQAVRLLTNEAEYQRQILKYNKKTVQSKNDHGGLRIYSFSDAEMFHLIDIIQVITDSAAVGLSLQGYTKVNEYAKAVKDTGEKLNRSLIPKGDLGYHMENGKVVLDYDTVEGIDIHHKDFFDNKDNPNVGNITIGINDVQIRASMLSDFVDQIIPFHTGQSEEVLGEKGIAAWDNYKDSQTEKDLATGRTSSHQVNIYTEVFQAAEAEGKPIQNKRQFVEKFLQVCKENGLQPRFAQFLNTDANGDYIYTEGYHKFLVDFKTFAQTEVGEYLPQMPVKPIFDDAYITGLLEAYVEEQQAKDAEVAKQMPKVIERITNEIVKTGEKHSDRDPKWKPNLDSTEWGIVKYTVDKNRGTAITSTCNMFFEKSKGKTLFGIYSTDDSTLLYASRDDKAEKEYNFAKRLREEYENGNVTDTSAKGLSAWAKTVRLQLVGDDDHSYGNVAPGRSAGNAELHGRPSGLYSSAALRSVLANILQKRTAGRAGDGRVKNSDRYSDRDYVAYDRTAILKESKVDEYLHDYAAKDAPKYAQAYIAYMRPRDFLHLTTDGMVERYYIDEQAGELDEERLSKSRPGIYLRIDHETGEVTGHEGRHRMSAMSNAGIDHVPVLFVDTSNKMTKTDIAQITLHGQFDATEMGVVRDLIPLNFENRDRVIKNFATQSNIQRIGEQYGHKTLRFSERTDDSVSNRSLLANAFEGIVQNSVEYKMLQDYKDHIKQLNKLENELSDLNAEIRKIRFGTEGARDTARLTQLEDKAKRIAKDINRYDKRLLNMEASEPLRKVIDREKVKASQKTKEHVKEIQQNKKLRAEQTELRHKIRKAVRDLDKILNRGNKKLNVKEDMQVVVNKALKAADILFTDNYGNYDMLRNGIGADLSDSEEELVNTCTQMLKDIDRMPTDGYESWQARQEAESRLNIKMSKLKDVFARERKRLNNTTVSSILGELADAYASLEKSEQSYVQGAYTEAVHNFLKSLQSEVGGTVVRDMTKSQLESVYAAYQMVLNTVRNANKMFNQALKQSREQLGNAVIQEVVTTGGTHGLWTKGEAARSQASWNNMKPVWVANRIGSETFGKLMDGLFKGQYNFAVDVDEAKQFKLSMDEKYHPRNWDAEKLYSFESSTGKKIELNLQQIMSLYAFSKREQAYSHILNGGFVFEANSTVLVDKKGIKRTYLHDGATSYKLNEVTLNEIISSLTSEQKAYVDEMQKYLSEVMGAKGNEVSLKLYGIKMFKEQFYFPLRSSGAYMEKAKEAEMKKQQGQINIVNSGFTHAVKPEAKNPIILSGFLDVWAEHCNEMSMYHSMVLPMEDFRKVYNYSTIHDEKMDSASVYQTIQDAYGKAATGYIDQLYRELNAGATVDPRETAFKARISKFKKAAVMLSASVVVQQFSSIGRAYAVIDPKYFVGARVKSDTKLSVADEMKKYAPVAIIKEMGGFDTGTKGSAKNFIMAEEYHKTERIKGLMKDEQYRGDVMSYLPAKADELTWCNIWEAVKRETKAKHQGMDVTSEEFLKLAGERFSEVIEKTQVYDSVLARSANMRSKGGLMSMATAFMAEPTTTINLLEDALRGRSVKNIARAFGAVATSIILNNALASVVYAMRDDDDDETFIEKYFQSFASGMVDDINPMTYYPFLKDVYSLFQGYDVERADMSVIADLRDALKKAMSVIGKDTSEMDEDELADHYKQVNGVLMSLLDAGCSALGVPLKNVRRDASGIINAYQTISKDLTERDTSWNTFWDKVGSAVKDTIPIYAWTKDKPKADKLYDAIMSGDTTYLGRIKSTYKTEDAYTSAVRKVLRENDPRIREAAEAKYETNSTEYKRIFREIQSEGHFSFDDIMSAINAEVSAIKKEREPSSVSSEYSATDFVNAMILGEVQNAEAMKNEIISTKVANGATSEEAAESFAGSVSTSTRKAFDSNLLDEAGVEKMLVEYAGMDEEEATAKTSYWAFIKANPKYRDVLSQDNVEKFHEFAEPANIPLDVFAQYVTGTKGLETIRDDWGDEVKSKREQVLEVIDSLPLTWQQKDALYLAAGYAESKILDVPW